MEKKASETGKASMFRKAISFDAASCCNNADVFINCPIAEKFASAFSFSHSLKCIAAINLPFPGRRCFTSQKYYNKRQPKYSAPIFFSATLRVFQKDIDDFIFTF